MATIVYIGAYEPKDDNEIPDNTNPAWRIHQGATDYIVVDTSDDEESVDLVSSGTGTVGIGSGFTTPHELLHIANSGTEVGDDAYIKFTTEAGGHGAGDGAHIGLNKTGTFQIAMDDANDILLMQGAAPRLTVDSVGVTTLSSSPAGANTGGLILTNSNGGSETFIQTRNTGDSLYSYGFGRHRSGSFQITQKANSTYGGAAQTVLLIDPEEGSHTNTFSEAVTGNVTDQYCAALKIDPAYTADSASTFAITNSNYISLQDPAAANAGSGDLNITNAPVFKLDAALGTHKATTNTDKSSGTASGTLKVDVNGTLYHIQLYAD